VLVEVLVVLVLVEVLLEVVVHIKGLTSIHTPLQSHFINPVNILNWWYIHYIVTTNCWLCVIM